MHDAGLAGLRRRAGADFAIRDPDAVVMVFPVCAIALDAPAPRSASAAARVWRRDSFTSVSVLAALRSYRKK
jgi:hypothetical protein